jgi:drug/metabolite transporter (DMT)-like permease
LLSDFAIWNDEVWVAQVEFVDLGLRDELINLDDALAFNGDALPPELSMFRLIAAIGVMVGYRVGQLVGRLVRPRPKRFLILIVGAVLCFYFAFGYASMMQTRSANTSDIVNLGAVLGLFFLSLGFLLPFTRVLVPSEIEILWSKAFEYFARLFRG